MLKRFLLLFTVLIAALSAQTWDNQACGAERPTPRATTEESLRNERLIAPPGTPGGPVPVERESGLNRADPGYIQWLDKQSLLTTAEELSKIVSGSQLPWRAPSLPPEPLSMVSGAGVWLSVHPNTLFLEGSATAFTVLSGRDMLQLLDYLRVKGLYISPVMVSGAIWAYTRTASMHGADAIQYGFSELCGSAEEFARLRKTFSSARITMGSDMLPAATGLGSDFFLAARAARNFSGVYCMIEIPRELWANLPPPTTEWKGVRLEAPQIEALAKAGYMPAALARDSMPWTSLAGWAATGEVLCSDGFTRRWVYCFSNTPDRPVLNWDDPSAGARQILSASLIQQVGMNGFSLTGLRIEPMLGLDAVARGAQSPAASGEPGITAACSLGREVRRYGGRSVLREEFPIPVLKLLLDQAVEFAADSVTSPAAEHALLTGDVQLLRSMLDEALAQGLDFRRLVHAGADQEGISYALPHLAFLGTQSLPGSGGVSAAQQRLDLQKAMREAAAIWISVFPRPLKDTLPLSGAGLAALAAGVEPTAAKRPEAQALIRDGHVALTFFKAMQPGLLQLSGQDLVGALPLPWRVLSDSPDQWDVNQTARGSYSLGKTFRSTGVTRLGVPTTPVAYEPPMVQIFQSDSYLAMTHRIIQARELSRIGEGSLTARIPSRGKGCVALLTKLERGGYVLAVTNFNKASSAEYLNLSLVPGLEAARDRVTLTDMFSGENLKLDRARLPLPVAGLGVRAVHIALNGDAPLSLPAEEKKE